MPSTTAEIMDLNQELRESDNPEVILLEWLLESHGRRRYYTPEKRVPAEWN